MFPKAEDIEWTMWVWMLLFTKEKDMQYYAQFLISGTDGEPQDLLGSDGVYVLDGRNHIGSMCKDSFNRIEKLKAVQPHIIGFKIMKGKKFTESYEVHRWLIRK